MLRPNSEKSWMHLCPSPLTAEPGRRVPFDVCRAREDADDAWAERALAAAMKAAAASSGRQVHRAEYGPDAG